MLNTPEENVTTTEKDDFAADSAIIREKVDRKVLYFTVIAVLIAVLLIAFIFNKNGNSTQKTPLTETSSNEERVLTVEGVVTAVNYENNELTAVLSSGREGLVQNDDLEGVSKTIKISPNTVVQKLIFSKDEEKLIDQSDTIEINVTDIFKNDRVIIEYAGLKNDEVINNVKSISVAIETESFTETLANEVAKISKEPFLGVKGKVISVDESKSMVTYYPYSLGKLGTEEAVASLKSGAKIYMVNNESRIDIEHAKTEILWDEINEGDNIFIVVSPEVDLTEANHKNLTAESFLLVK